MAGGTTGLLVLFVALTAVFWWNPFHSHHHFIPHFDTTISFNHLEEQIRQLVPALSVNYNNVSLEKLTAGTSNIMFKVTSDNHIINNASILLVRVFGEGASLLCNRTQEVEMVKLFYQQGLGSEVFATFNNGYVLEYMEGKTLQPGDIRSPYYYIPIAKKLGQLHAFVQPSSVSSSGHKGIFEHLDFWMRVCRQLTKKDELLAHLKKVENEISDLEKRLESYYGNQSLVFSHNDLNYANVIYNVNAEGGADITLLDLEYAGFGYRGFDLGNHFCEMAGQGDIDWNNYPSHDTMRKFLRAYLEGNKGSNNISQNEIDLLVIESERWAQVSHVAWHVWALAMSQAENKVTNDFDYYKYSFTRLNEYVRRKDALKDLL